MERLLNEELRKFSYYEKKIPLYLRNDTAFAKHFKIWFDLLVSNESANSTKTIENTLETLLYLLNIFDEKYDEFIDTFEGTENISVDVIDKLGNLFGLRRTFDVKIENTSKTLTLTNDEFVKYIRATIIKNYFDGSYETLWKYYQRAGLNIVCITSNPGIAQITLVLTTPDEYSQNIKDLFDSHSLTLESLGISYNYAGQTAIDILIWDSDQRKWDGGTWSI